MVATGAATHGRQVERVLWIVLALNLMVAAAKFFYGLASGSASMQADGIHSVFDSLGNVIGLIGISLAARPADDGHPYGHSKFETYGSLAIGVLLLVAAFEVGTSAVAKLASQSYTASVTPVSFAVMVGTLAVNVGVTMYERRAGRRLHSEILAADAAHKFRVHRGAEVGKIIRPALEQPDGIKIDIQRPEPLQIIPCHIFIITSQLHPLSLPGTNGTG